MKNDKRSRLEKRKILAVRLLCLALVILMVLGSIYYSIAFLFA